MREEEQGMWEDIELVDYDGAFQRLEEAEREIEKSKREKAEIARKAEEANRKTEGPYGRWNKHSGKSRRPPGNLGKWAFQRSS
jgi:hypothetical protein